MAFDQLGLSTDLLRALKDAGYDRPTPIQHKAIPAVFMGRDVLGCAQTGTGKTASFTLPMLDILAEGGRKARMPRALILEPTRELATQVADNFDKYGKFHSLSKVVLIGGRGFADQERLLARGVDVLIATPGRLLDLFERGKILLNDTRYLVIDEADRMLDMGFIPDVERIVSLMPPRRQTLFFSATMPPEIRHLADSFLNEPREITVSPPTTAAVTVDHSLTKVGARQKAKALCQLIRQEQIACAIIFCNRKREISILGRKLKENGIEVGEMHGDMPQPRREATMEAFRDGKIKLLIASDVAARGIDVQGISHVFNYDVPQNPEDYIHRIGRTGRAGQPGRALTLATSEDDKAVMAINRMLGQEIRLCPLPGSKTSRDGGAVSPSSPSQAEAGQQMMPAPSRPLHNRLKKRPSPGPDSSQRRSLKGKKAPTDRQARPQNDRQNDRQSKAAPSIKPVDKECAPVSRRDPVIGMGDHVPAFLAWETPVSSQKTRRQRGN